MHWPFRELIVASKTTKLMILSTLMIFSLSDAFSNKQISRVTNTPFLILNVFSTPVAVVGLESTFHQVSEEVGVMEVCAVVYSPNDIIPCPINFAFNLSLSTIYDGFSSSNGSKGDEH